MTCAEFQAVLPYIIDNGGNAEQQEHLRNCEVCSGLVNDLKYIAEQAKLLVPMMEPPKKVWDGIKTSLEQEGLVKDSARGSLLSSSARTRWGPSNWLLPIAAALLVAVGLFYYHNNIAERQAPTEANSAMAGDTANVAGSSATAVQSASMGNEQDRQILSEIASHAPSLSQAYQEDLQRVNAYIADAQGIVARNPDDEDSRQALMEAYQQKAMLYNMAMRHSLP
ncbi:MAG TPA: anti-sigma factor [Terriglobales bacterium]|nr:anti-sigma factor [Terriglobales bacterium]